MGFFGGKNQFWVTCRFKMSLKRGLAIDLKPVTAFSGLLLTKKCQKPDCNRHQIEYFINFIKLVKWETYGKFSIFRPFF